MIRHAIAGFLAAWILALVIAPPIQAQPGTAWSWGYGHDGQLGNGSDEDQALPTQVYGLTDVVDVSAGDYHGLALRADGTVWAWGDNETFQLGDGTVEPSYTPVQVLGPGGVGYLNNVVAIAAGDWHNLVLRSDGTVWAWGWNFYGQLGDGTNEDSEFPVQVRGPGGVGVLNNVVAIAACGWHSLALRSDGTVWAWGYNTYGQLGDNTKTHRNTPVQVVGLSSVQSIAAGFRFSLAVKSDGTAWGWGRNRNGELGNNSGTDHWVPVQFEGLPSVRAMAGGWWHTLVLLADGTLRACGSNTYGQLGNGTNTDSTSPVTVLGLSNVTAIACGDYHCLARRSDGTVWTWGWNDHGELGDGTTNDSNVPVQVVGLTGVARVDGGYSFSLACIGDTSNTPPTADDQRVTAVSGIGRAITLTGSDADGDPLTFRIVTQPAHGTVTGTPPNVTYTSDSTFSGTDTFRFVANDGVEDSLPATVTVDVEKAATSLWTVNRTGTITETVTLRQYDLKRTADNGLLPGRTISYLVDGTEVGTAVTDGGGDSILNWVITDGPASRSLTVVFAGDGGNLASSAEATLTAQSWTTKMATFDRTARIADRTELKCRLLRSDNTPVYNKLISFYVDGTWVINRPTDVQGYAKYPYYDVPDGAGAGERVILSEWAGNAGYAAISKTAKLTVLKAIPYIWVMPRSVPKGQGARLYAYFRRLYDYAKQEGKTVSWSIDGTWIGASVTGTTESGEPGVARFLYDTSVLSLGTHTVRCEWAGDAWVDAGCGEANLTIY